jgi:hypothetical protein
MRLRVLILFKAQTWCYVCEPDFRSMRGWQWGGSPLRAVSEVTKPGENYFEKSNYIKILSLMAQIKV